MAPAIATLRDGLLVVASALEEAGDRPDGDCDIGSERSSALRPLAEQRCF